MFYTDIYLFSTMLLCMSLSHTHDEYHQLLLIISLIEGTLIRFLTEELGLKLESFHINQ